MISQNHYQHDISKPLSISNEHNMYSKGSGAKMFEKSYIPSRESNFLIYFPSK